ncbi:YadA-like family protein [Moraxella catarrhalis]|uniref:Ubiquitous surface protein A2 n=1 Tax=Moraxella catarrhalis TaxID=480 RepID=B5L5S4_MORCA|nr:YadA-like family protein [Moraxella catarrhalis]ACB58309.1 ubiquitous surface protein A2 [Moraxella catarrhalis 7169]
MKTMKLLPLKIAVTSALIVGLGAASTANAQAQDRSLEQIQDKLANLVEKIEQAKSQNGQSQKDINQYLLLSQYANVLTMEELNNNVVKNSSSIETLDNDIAWLNDDLIDLDKEVGVLSRDIGSLHDDVAQNQADIKTLKNNVVEELFNLSDRLIDQEADIAQNNESIEDLYDFGREVAESIGEIHAHNEAQNETLKDLITNSVKNTDNITKNKADIQALENDVGKELLNLSGRLIDQKADIDNNINHIYELAQQQDQHSSDIKTLKNNVEEGLLELSGHLIDQKADLTKDIKALESNVEEGLLDLSGRLLDQKADIAQNQANIQDLAAYNELQDAYAKQQTEAIDALNKASSENTQNIEDLAAYNELQDAYAKQQTEAIDALNKASSENTQNIAKNQADIANNINNIYELAQQQDQHSSDIKTLAKASAANTDRIAKNKADADASFETLTKNQNTLIEKDKEHDKLITANKTAIDANKASADTKFAATADAITKNGNAITKNAKSITDLGTKVDGFDSRVTALDTKVNAFDGRITALDSKVENGMAAQAALSGLFQPYSVGKFNATAALGGYGSKSAVAIGAGYRVNPNLAFKAGAAINTSGNKKGSYNIGVNYEF